MSWIEIDANRRASERRADASESHITVRDIPYKCRIIDVSDTGARVELTTAVFIDGEIRLVMGAEEAEILCEIAWRDGMRLGLKFVE